MYEHGTPTVRWSSSDASPLPCDLIYIKIPKCASSTTGGVARRIAAKHNLSGVHEKGSAWRPEPVLWANHGKLAAKWSPLHALHQRAFLWTMVRQPVPRCLSAYYHFMESRHDAPNTAHAKVAYLRGCRDSVYSYTSPPKSAGLFTPHQLVRDVYSFVGLVERYEESIVLLASMLRVPLAHVLFLKAKVSTEGGAHDGLGIAFVPHPPLDEEPPSVQDEAWSASFNASNRNDYELYHAANAELERRWAANRAVLDANLRTFRSMLMRAKELCGNWTSEDCYWNDNGCGVECLDSHFTE